MTVSVRFLDSGTYVAKDDRSLLTALRGQQGVMYPRHMIVTQRAAGATMSVDVAPGWASVAGTLVDYQMDYLVQNDTVVNVPIGPAHATLQRNDIIVARVWDNPIDGLGLNKADILAIVGTPGAGDPVVPQDCLPLARVRVTAAATLIVNSLIDDRRDPFVLAPAQNNPQFGQILRAYHGVSFNFNTVTTNTDTSISTVAGDNTLSFTLPYENTFAHGFRRYEVGGRFKVQSDTANALALFKLLLDDTLVNSFYSSTISIPVTATNFDVNIKVIEAGVNIAPGDHTLKAVFQLPTGSGTLSSNFSQWWIKDLGQYST
jgi:hypothetical protein